MGHGMWAAKICEMNRLRCPLVVKQISNPALVLEVCSFGPPESVTICCYSLQEYKAKGASLTYG